MAKSNTFEDLLNAEFRWPRKGDLPFGASDDWDRNASLEERASTRVAEFAKIDPGSYSSW